MNNTKNGLEQSPAIANGRGDRLVWFCVHTREQLPFGQLTEAPSQTSADADERFGRRCYYGPRELWEKLSEIALTTYREVPSETEAAD